MKVLLKKVCLFMMMLLLTATVVHAEEWKFALEVVEGDVQDIYAQEFKKQIEAKTNGKVTINIYHYGTLGDSTDLTELAADGAIQFANASPGHLGSFIPEVQMFAVPYIFSDSSSVNNELLSGAKAIYTELASDFDRRGIKLMTMYSSGSMVWVTNRVVRSPEDLNNFKMRILAAPMLVETYKDFGASPTPMSFGEVYGGLQMKAIDGMANPLSSIAAMKFYEVAPNLIWPKHQLFADAVITGSDWFDGLSQDKQQLITSTFRETSKWLSERMDQIEENFLAEVKAAKPDINVVRFTEEERKPFRKAAKATQQKYIDLVGPRGKKVLETFLKERETLEARIAKK
jgi:tripartite ATP-independent transporter DctP family solute receptor